MYFGVMPCSALYVRSSALYVIRCLTGNQCSLRRTAWNAYSPLFLSPAIDGGFSEWSELKCSVTCGGGVKTFTRTCTNPPPSNDGKDCSELGPVKKTVSCNEQECRECFYKISQHTCYYSKSIVTRKPGSFMLFIYFTRAEIYNEKNLR